MRTFNDEDGRDWVATALEEKTPRHHGRFYLAFRPATGDGAVVPMPEVRWQTAASAERTIATMATFELVRRLRSALSRTGSAGPVGRSA